MFELLRSQYSYSLASRIWGFVLDEDKIGDEILFDFFADINKLAKPQKSTALHDLIYNVFTNDLDYSTGSFPDLEVGTYRALLNEAGMPIPKWLNSDKVAKHIAELDEMLSQAAKVVIPSTFFLLYSDRAFLSDFQNLASRYIKKFRSSEHPHLFSKDGSLKRLKYIPGWLKSAVFHRDKGRCQLCFKDMTGLREPVRDLELDHIIPLALSGSNDPTNFQLVCRTCNRSKGPNRKSTKPRFIPYW